MPRTFRLLFLGWLAVAYALAALPAAAQPYPSRPVKIIVPFGPGSGADNIARVLAEELRRDLGGSFVIENREGASGIVGLQQAARAAPDGYTLVLASVTAISANPFLFKSLPYDPVKDFQAVANVLETQQYLLVRAESPVRTAAELIATLKAAEGKAYYGYGNAAGQITSAAFVKRIGATATAVPYKSSPQAVTDLIGGQLTFMFLDAGAAVGHIKGGRVRALAIASEARVAVLPDVPTLSESGLTWPSAAGWVGMLAPAGTPPTIVERVNAAINAALQRPAVRERLSSAGVLSGPMNPQQFSDYLARQRVAWGDQIRDADVQPQ